MDDHEAFFISPKEIQELLGFQDPYYANINKISFNPIIPEIKLAKREWIKTGDVKLMFDESNEFYRRKIIQYRENKLEKLPDDLVHNIAEAVVGKTEYEVVRVIIPREIEDMESEDEKRVLMIKGVKVTLYGANPILEEKLQLIKPSKGENNNGI
jgi:hypothetical protein